MRDLTEAEKHTIYDEAKCIFCGSEDFYEGPHGGMQINWYCANEECLAGYNLSPPALRYAQLIRLPIGALPGEDERWFPTIPQESLRSVFKRRTTLRVWFEMLRSSPWG